MSSRAERGLPSLEVALRYLLGDRSFDRIEEDDDDEAEEALDGSTLTTLPADLLRNNVNVPPPRRGGATFGPSGQLVVFFPTNVFVTTPTEKDGSATPPNESETQRAKFPLRLSEAFGNLPSESPDYEGDYQETDEALQMTTGRSYRAVRFIAVPYLREVRLIRSIVNSILWFAANPSHSLNLVLLLPPSAPSSKSRMYHILRFSILPEQQALSIDHLSSSREKLSKRQSLLGISCYRKCGRQSLHSLRLGWGQTEITRVTSWNRCWLNGYFKNCAHFFVLLDYNALNRLDYRLVFLAHLKDVQTLGVIACLLESFTRGESRILYIIERRLFSHTLARFIQTSKKLFVFVLSLLSQKSTTSATNIDDSKPVRHRLTLATALLFQPLRLTHDVAIRRIPPDLLGRISLASSTRACSLFEVVHRRVLRLPTELL